MQNPSRILTPEEIWDSTYRCEYLIIGSGAGGSVCLDALTKAGKDVLVLEEGEPFDTQEASDNRIGTRMRKYYRNGGVSPFWGKPPIGFAEGKCVGGTTLINGGLLWRTPQAVLQEWYENGLRGYQYADLLPHFETIERRLKVTSVHNIPNSNKDSLQLEKASKDLGWKYVPAPRAVNDCVNSNRCASGCPTGAKQSMVESYIPEALHRGGRILSSTRAVRLQLGSLNRIEKVEALIGGKRSIQIAPDHVIFAGGAIQTPFLLQKNRIAPLAGKKLQFHINLKVVALFQESLDAKRGTIFTGQVQEFAEEGIYFMASNYQPHYVASTLGQFGKAEVEKVVRDEGHGGIFVAQVRPKSRGHIHHFMKSDPLVTYHLEETDFLQCKKALSLLGKLLFAAGAHTLYLPTTGGKPIRNLGEAESALSALTAKQLEMISVHAMASCPMGTDSENSVTDSNGKIWDIPNAMISDASVLPSNIGESPQGTVMAFAHEIMRRHLDEAGI